MAKTDPIGSMVKIDGDKNLIRQFRALSKGLGQKALTTAVARGAELIVDEAKAKAPVRSGRLRRSIRSVLLTSRPKEASVGVSWQVGKSSRTPAFYGAVVEKGSKPRERKTWRKKPLETGPVSTGTMPSQPFLEPAYDAKKAEATARVKRELVKLIKKTAQRG